MCWPMCLGRTGYCVAGISNSPPTSAILRYGSKVSTVFSGSANKLHKHTQGEQVSLMALSSLISLPCLLNMHCCFQKRFILQMIFLKNIFNIVVMKTRKKKAERVNMVEEAAQAGTPSIFTTWLAKTTVLRSRQRGW